MKIVVGLGNPGKRYERTRHNVGWRVLDALASTRSLPGWQDNALRQALLTKRGNLLLVKPQTFMNQSGQAVAKISRFYKVAPADILIVGDDLHLPLGAVRYRNRGSAGGQKGLASVIEALGTPDIPRLRIGIDEPTHSATEHVLATFSDAEEAALPEIIERAAAKVVEWLGE